MRKWKIGIAVGIILVLLCVSGCSAATVFTESTIGSPDCIVAADYNSLTYCGKRYVPIFLGEADCVAGEELVSECQVENSGFFGKLFFGEKLWAVKGVTDYEMLYLQTDYDACISPYFVLESKQEAYEERLQRAEYDQTYILYIQEDGLGRELLVELDLELLNRAAMGEAAKDTDWASPDRLMEVRCYDADHVFYRLLGELRQKNGRWFWCPCSVFEQDGTLTYGSVHYPVDGDPFPGA